MNDLDFKRIMEIHIKDKLNKVLSKNCNKYNEDDYVIQDNKYNENNNDITTYKIEEIDFNNNTVKISNVNNKTYPLENKKIYVNYNIEIDTEVIGDNLLRFSDNDTLYLLAVGDIITETVDKQNTKVYIIVDIDEVIIENNYITSTHDNQIFTTNVFVGINDYKDEKDKEKYDFFFNEVIRIFREQSFNINYNNKNLDIFTVNKPRYKSSIKTENDRVGYIILTHSHIYDYRK